MSALALAAGRRFRALALCDDTDTCEFCGKTDLMRVVAFEDVDTGEILYAGTTCAQTVQLLVVDDETKEAAPRTAKQIVSFVERKNREAALAEKLELAGWQVAWLLDGWRESEYTGALVELEIGSFCSRGSVEAGYALGRVLIPGNGNRSRFSLNLLCGWLHRTEKIKAGRSLASREKNAAALLEYIENYRQTCARLIAGSPVW